MRTSSKTIPLLFSFVTLACQEKVAPSVPPTKTQVSPVSNAQSAPSKAQTQGAAMPTASTSSPTSQAAFVDPVPRWATFFQDKLHGAPELTLVGDFNGDGLTDVAVRTGDEHDKTSDDLYLFHDTSLAEPKEWEHMAVSEDAPLRVKDAAWAIEKLPELKGKLSEKQSVITLGDKAPLVYFWYEAEKCYAWLQVIPAELGDARKDAEASYQASFGITKNNLSNEKGFYGEPKLAQGFVGDFEQDGVLDLVVVSNDSESKGNVFFYANGAKKPTTHEVDYWGSKMALFPGTAPLKMEGAFEEGPVTIPGNYIYLELPEKSSVAIYYDKKAWKRYWLGD